MKKCAILIVFAMLALSPALLAHNWGCYQQPGVNVGVKNSGGGSAGAAISEWDTDTVINISGGSDVRVFGQNSGNTGWGGLATIWTQGCTITYCEAQLNTYYSWTSNEKRGVYCQEVGHCWGLDHSNDGGCMGAGYYYNVADHYNVVSHNISDMESKYGGSGGGGCTGGGNGASCSTNSDCCSNKCRNGVCKGSSALAASTKDGDHHEGPGHGDDEQRFVVEAVWVNNPRDLNEALELSDAVVYAEVTNIFDTATIKNEGTDVPTQLIQLDVHQVLHGEIHDSFELFHTGDSHFVLFGDPAYEIGERYVLFLTPREDGSYLVISPEGRYQVIDGFLNPISLKSMAEGLRGFTVEGLALDLAERRANRRDTQLTPKNLSP